MKKYIPFALSASLLLAGCGPRLEPTQADVQGALNTPSTPEQTSKYPIPQIIEFCGPMLYDSSEDADSVAVLALQDTISATNSGDGKGISCAYQGTNLQDICPADPLAYIAGFDAENGVVNIKGDCNGDGTVENTNLMGDPANTKTGQSVKLVKPWYEN